MSKSGPLIFAQKSGTMLLFESIDDVLEMAFARKFIRYTVERVLGRVPGGVSTKDPSFRVGRRGVASPS